MHPAVPFAGQHGARPQVDGLPVRVHRALAGVFGRCRTIEQPPALGIQIAETIGLKPIGQNTKQQMSWQVRGGQPSRTPYANGLEDRSDVEITQARDLDVDCLPVRLSRTDLDARHDAQDARRLDWRRPDLPPSPPAIW